jgi:hypothetical protein
VLMCFLLNFIITVNAMRSGSVRPLVKHYVKLYKNKQGNPFIGGTRLVMI